MLVALSHAFDTDSISNLLFLKKTQEQTLYLSGDGVLTFSHLIASGLAKLSLADIPNTYNIRLYRVTLTDKGNRIIDAWFSGNREDLRNALGGIIEP